MIFRLLYSGIQGDLYRGKFHWDNIEPLPGNFFITGKEIFNYTEKKNFFVMGPEGDIFIEYPEDFFSYFDLWENFHHFGLPHGKGFINELPWVIDFLKYFENIYESIKTYNIKKGGG